MNKIAPQQFKKITSRIKKPWYDNDLKHQRQIVKNRERKWLKYREQSHWKAYKSERNRFITMIKYKKRDYLHNQISATTGNSKKLYQLITNLTSQNKSNPLPAPTSDENLVEEFATYFLEKICNIRKLFNGIPNYKPTPTNIPPLNKFSTLPESQLYKIIMEMPSTTCELDIIPTKFLKKGPHALYTSINQSSQPLIKLGAFLQRLEASYSKTSHKVSKKRNRKIQVQACKQSTIHIQSC